MQQIPVNTNAAGLALPLIGLGTWGMGGKAEKDPANDDKRDVQAIGEAISLGLTHIDTAELYAAGHAEELVAQGTKGVARSSIQIATKVMGPNHGPDNLLAACERSLKRLQTDYIDLYYLHWRNPSIPLKETAAALNKLLADGRIKHIGVCNFHVATMQELQAHLDAPIAVNQSHYNLVYREPERAGLLDYCRKERISFLAWRPVLWNEPHHPSPSGNAWERGFVPLFDEMADRYGKANVELAVNWLINQPNVSTLVKTSRIEHLKEISGCLDWTLSEADIEKLRRDFPNQRDVSCAVPLG